MIICPNCNEISRQDINIYNKNLRKQNFDISPILPTCKHCNAEVKISNRCTKGNIIILNGTCGSGKSTVAEILATRGFGAIDGDCVIQVVKHKTGQTKMDFREQAMFDEITCQIDILSMLGDNFVLSHVILPEDMSKFTKIFEERNLNYHFFLLKPSYQTAVARCQTRTCHNSVTPEEWIKYFYDALVFGENVTVEDNTNMTATQTADYILEAQQ